MKIKCSFYDEIYEVELDEPNYNELVNKLKVLVPEKLEKVVFTYHDEDGDKIIIKTNPQLQAFLKDYGEEKTLKVNNRQSDDEIGSLFQRLKLEDKEKVDEEKLNPKEVPLKLKKLNKLDRKVKQAIRRFFNKNQELEEQNNFKHIGVTCTKCGISPIVGLRYSCQTCEKFNLCQKCEKAKKHVHPLLKMRESEYEDDRVRTLIEIALCEEDAAKLICEQYPESTVEDLLAMLTV